MEASCSSNINVAVVISSVLESPQGPQMRQICTGAGRKEVELLRVRSVHEAQHQLPVYRANGVLWYHIIP